MAFMQPFYSNAAFHVADNRMREREAIPADVYGTLDRFMDAIGTRDDDRADGETVLGKWWARLSAPGYTDATEWSGPFDSAKDAEDYIRDHYEVDPDTGDDLDEESEGE